MLKAMAIGVLASWGAVAFMAVSYLSVSHYPATTAMTLVTLLGAGLGYVAYGGHYR